MNNYKAPEADVILLAGDPVVASPEENEIDKDYTANLDIPAIGNL